METKIIDHLIAKYRPKAIILHGSRVEGLNRPNSDWDLLVIVDSDAQGKTEVFEGQSLDVDVLNQLPRVEDFLKTRGPILQRATVLFDDESGLGRTFLSSVQEILAQGKNLSQQEYDNRFLRMSRLLDKMLGCASSPELFFMHAGVFVELAHRFWFEFKSMWSQPPYIGLPRIQMEDPFFYNLLCGLSRELEHPLRMNYAFQIYKYLFPKEYKEHLSITALLEIESQTKLKSHES